MPETNRPLDASSSESTTTVIDGELITAFLKLKPAVAAVASAHPENKNDLLWLLSEAQRKLNAGDSQGVRDGITTLTQMLKTLNKSVS